MAAPESVTLKNLSGKYIMNKKISTNPEPILALQGIGWVMRKGIGMATITLNVAEYVDDEGVTHIDIDQIGTGGFKGTSEKRALNWEQGEHTDHIFGKVKGQSRWTKVANIQDEFLKTGWLPESVDGDVIESNVKSLENEWEAFQIWGFREKDGTRYYARNVVVTKGDKRLEAHLYYDFQGQ